MHIKIFKQCAWHTVNIKYFLAIFIIISTMKQLGIEERTWVLGLDAVLG